jgi:hypothetical protein
MKRLGSILVPLLTVGLGTMFATTTDELEIQLGGNTAIISDNGACTDVGASTACATLSGDSTPAAGTDTVSGTLGNWSILVTSGTSSSPSDVPFGLDLTSLTATCESTCAGQTLIIRYSDINFSPANPSFITGYSTTINGTGGSTSESAYYDNTNTIFGTGTLIGTVGPFTSTSSGTTTGGVGSVAPYSLTLVQTFSSSGGTGALSFSSDGSVASVPEPSAFMLFGSVLVGCGVLLRRRSVKA